jgi:Raf kinase inhibitor-like YbhB/YbcL family protein
MRLFLRILLAVIVIVTLLIVGLRWRAGAELVADAAYHKNLPRTVSMTSTSFADGDYMPVECTCKGREASPGILYENQIPGAKSFALLMTDPDVPSPAYPLFNLTHWIVYNLNPATARLMAESTPAMLAQLGGSFGKNSTGSLKYIGPCPPMGKHAYLIRVYALDTKLRFDEAPGKPELMTAMTGHILSYGQLTGYYDAPRK